MENATHKKRIENISKVSEGKTILTTSTPNIFYLTGLYSSAGYLLLHEGVAYILVDGRYFERASNIDFVSAVLVEKSYTNTLVDFLKNKGITSVWAQKNEWTYLEYEELSLAYEGLTILWTDEIEKARIVKDKEEITLMKENLFLSERAYTKFLAFVKEGMSEKDCALELDYLLRKEGADESAFPTMVLFSENSSSPHAIAGERKLKKGDSVQLDFGMRKDGYNSDISRVFCFGKGDYSRLKEVHLAVCEAQKRAIESSFSGQSMASIKEAAVSSLNEKSLGKYFPHSIGHGLGIEVHEKPDTTHKSLQGGTIITIEPGVYIPKEFGVRIENEIIITRDTGICLNTFPEDLLIL